MNCAKASALFGDHLEGDLELRLRSEVDDHVAGCPSCARELRELRATVALLRSLPAPEPPLGLSSAIMQSVRGDADTRATVLPLPLRRLADPRFAAPLAAGISALVLFATMQGGTSRDAQVAATRAAPSLSERQEALDMWLDAPATLASGRRAVTLPRLVAIEQTAANRFFRPDPRATGIGFIGRTDPDPQRLDLDAQLEAAMADPLGFLHRVSETPEIDRGSTVAPLVLLAGRRGEAHRIAGRLRAASHPLARDIAERFEQRHRVQRGAMVVPVSHH